MLYLHRPLFGTLNTLVNKRTIRRKQIPAQELRKIERLLGEEFDNLTQARRALKLESIPTKKPTLKPAPKPITKPTPKTDFKFGANRKPAPTTKSKKGAATRAKTATKTFSKPKRFVAANATRAEKFKYAQKIGKPAYHRRVTQWWKQHPDEDPNDNPYTYHNKDE